MLKYIILILTIQTVLFSQYNATKTIKMNDGEVDFSTFTIYANYTSESEKRTLQSDMQIILQNEAELETQNKIYYTLTSMVFDSDLLISDVLQNNPSLNQEVLSLIRKSNLVGVSYPKRNSIKVGMALPLYKKNSHNMFDMFYNVVYKYNLKPVITYFNAAREFDYLVIDARDLDISPAMFPSVYDEDGNLIYDVSFIDKQYLSEVGYVKYAFDTKDTTISKKPYSIVAWRSRGKTKCDIVISNEDARLIASNEGLQNAIRRCNVIIII